MTDLINTTRIDNCDSAIVDIKDGTLIYSYELLVDHFHNVEGMKELDQYNDRETATEWVEFNIVRALPYLDNPPIIR